MLISNQKTISWSTLRTAGTKVHVWHASLAQPAEVVQELKSVLSEEERQRAERFHYREHQRSLIVGRGILRNLLYHYTGIQPDQILFKYNLAGKPFLSNGYTLPEIHFNLSHAGSLVLYAFSWGSQVGIDIERLRPMKEMDQVAEVNFSAGEYKKFQRIGEREKQKAFYNCWTRKEAFIKAVGDGMTFPLQDFDVSLEPDVPARLLAVHGSREEADHWTMYDLKTLDGYAAALAVEGKEHSITNKEWAHARFFEPGINP